MNIFLYCYSFILFELPLILVNSFFYSLLHYMLTFLSLSAGLLGKTGQFLRLIIYTSLTFAALQCFMQIPFTYIPPHGKKTNF